MKKFLREFFYGVLILIIAVVIGFVFYLIQQSKLIDVETGWQKMEINGVVPEGAILVISESSNLILKGDGEKTGFTKEGIVIFTEKDKCSSSDYVWVYIPEDYEVIVKIDGFLPQCNEKLSDLTGKTSVVEDIYFN